MHDDKDLFWFDPEQLVEEIKRLRQVIRYHRDQKGDDRCWLDDQKLYELLPEHEQADFRLPQKEGFLRNCEKFWKCRQNKKFKNVDDCYKNTEGGE